MGLNPAILHPLLEGNFQHADSVKSVEALLYVDARYLLWHRRTTLSCLYSTDSRSDVCAATLQSTRFKRAAKVAPHNKKRMKDIPLTDNILLGAPMT